MITKPPVTLLTVAIDDVDIDGVTYEQYDLVGGNAEIVIKLDGDFIKRCNEQDEFRSIVITEEEIMAILKAIGVIKLTQLLDGTTGHVD